MLVGQLGLLLLRIRMGMTPSFGNAIATLCSLPYKVAQLHGRKRWLLYPPADTANLYPTRVPYEESSVFSRVDARAPDLDR